MNTTTLTSDTDAGADRLPDAEWRHTPTSHTTVDDTDAAVVITAVHAGTWYVYAGRPEHAHIPSMAAQCEVDAMRIAAWLTELILTAEYAVSVPVGLVVV